MKLRKKLFLSCAALAVCATTMVSTTYAWYVTNATASASNITGSTASAGAAGNLFVAHATSTGELDGNYSPAIDFDGTYWASTAAAVKLDPVHATMSDNTLSFTNKDGGTVAEETACITYKFYLWDTDMGTEGNATSDDVSVTLTVTNTTGTLPQQVSYSNLGSGVTPGTKFSVDAVYALRMAVEIGDLGNNVYDVAAVSGYSANVPTVTSAHDYYKAVTGKDAPSTADDNSVSLKSTMSSWTVTPNATTGQLVTIRIWLEGADVHCFDACGGQQFKFNFQFSIAEQGA